MFLLYIIMNLCIAGKLNKILMYKSVFFNLLPYPESFMGEKPLRLNLRIFGIDDNQVAHERQEKVPIILCLHFLKYIPTERLQVYFLDTIA